ncbi:U-box domain-containing protein 35-like isoform X2 [Juglans microcarpa x Juglans regia]|uniref:U-box domain-containing protein 35-like isoform X2 n=1 Tax=Juglans microcarpa x Juglans regia TaxID=2249226 RepID=UPI001B7EF136|nr:U-box domain-containing protein 35-like isoform X2 [Juglans microcarpa x Juglans regia]
MEQQAAETRRCSANHIAARPRWRRRMTWNDCVFVAVGDTESSSSMGALAWTLKRLVSPSTVLRLLHVFPVIRYIPSPLGLLPRSKVNPELVQNYVMQERGKRRKHLQKFLDACSVSKVKVDVMLVEGDNITKAIVDLIPILNIRKLVLGTTESSLRKSESKRGNGIADQILHNAPETCEIKIVCGGKEVIDRMIVWPSPSSNSKSKSMREGKEDKPHASFLCMCFNFKTHV